MVVPTLLYGYECWTLYRRQIKLLEIFHIRCLQRILRITWKDKIPHTEVLQRAEVVNIEAIIRQRLLRWVGHVRMSGSRLAKIVFYGELEIGRRPRGDPKKRFRDYIKRVLVSCNIDPTQVENLAKDRVGCRSHCVTGMAHFEEERREALKGRRRQRHLQPADSAPGMFPCQLCQRACHSQIGLLSHLASHRRRSLKDGQRRRQQ
ncbi:unnamed protein product [Acanthosepion pharaonis]|uniref:C2H2-type domain-containing protein n=1 Tax=Acanthosepion pharaonis TaxID=158019 RepID=A0A812E0A0_ACAPH|nr:unnamed protein product [Sepia pharaonis]